MPLLIFFKAFSSFLVLRFRFYIFIPYLLLNLNYFLEFSIKILFKGLVKEI
jgi:hypothetical protein